MDRLPFQIEIQPGSPAYEQVIQAVHRAVARGILAEGDPFPSVRVLGRAARINPNTAHKVVQALVAEGTLEVLPGRGTRIAPAVKRSARQRLNMIRADIESLVVEARRVGFELEDLNQALRDAWHALDHHSKTTKQP
ncbi:MAG TPA: GntR family transcriptional regulator [Luteolibacter sp.]|nr:GntR family transcriptional regulator [Luteolibacter sp.]